jgi:hypothetical protein
MNDEGGYRAPAPRPACTRCGVEIDAAHAVLSSDGGMLCARCDAAAQIDAQAARVQKATPRAIPWNDGRIAFVGGALLLLGSPVSIVGLWSGWLDFGVVFLAYAIGVPVVAVTTVRAFVARPKARGQAQVQAPAQVRAHAQPHAQAPTQANVDRGLAVAGASMATAGCGLTVVVVGTVVLLGLALHVIVALWVLKYLLGISSIPWP